MIALATKLAAKAAVFVPGVGPWLAALLQSLQTPEGRARAWFFMKLAGGALTLLAAYHAGHNRAERQCEAAALAEQLAAKQRDLEAAQEAATSAGAALARLERERNEARQRELEYAEELKRRPAKCNLTPDDIERMQPSAPGRRRRGA